MIAFARMLVEPALRAGMSVPPDPDDFKRAAFPHFAVFCHVQLGAPMPYPSAAWDNAKLIAALSDEEVKMVSIEDLIERGLATGYSTP